ncbi:MAG: hypothetical protein IJO82_00900, partial [Clostridia bacterium]|nr:hypothetical protein [Clostridia bacterium]
MKKFFDFLPFSVENPSFQPFPFAPFVPFAENLHKKQSVLLKSDFFFVRIVKKDKGTSHVSASRKNSYQLE